MKNAVALPSIPRPSVSGKAPESMVVARTRAGATERSALEQPITRRMPFETSPLPVAMLASNEAAVRRSAPTLPMVDDEGLVMAMFERLHALEYLEDALEGARFCLELLQTVFPARALLVHLFDTQRREFLVVDACGEAADALHLTRAGLTDLLLRLSMRKGVPVAWRRLQHEAPQEVLARFAALPCVETVFVAPVCSGPRWLGAFEIVDPVVDLFPPHLENALRHVAERYAFFLAPRGVIVDVATVARFALANE